jgi:LacI family transcriptional regulator
MLKEKEITIYDLANELNISVATVSRALKDDPAVNKKTKKKVYELAEKVGYRSNYFARNLRSQKTNTIGLIVSRINSNFQASVISGIEDIATKHGYNLIISQSSEQYSKEEANAKTMFNNRVDGLLVSLAFDAKNLNHFEPFFKKNIPIIFFDRVMQHPDSTSIVINNTGAAYKATLHLAEQGCKRIIHITAPSNLNVYTDRLKGYKQALEEQNIPFKKSNVIISNLGFSDGIDAAEKILSMKPLPDGVFVANDNCAVGCMIALKKAGIKIPDDIAFVGFNNDPVSEVIEPNLTTINYSGYEVGQIAAQQLISHVKGIFTISSTNTIILKSKLIVRASSLKNKLKKNGNEQKQVP